MLVKFDEDLPSTKKDKAAYIGFILDESGSMTVVWHDTMRGFNSYVNTLRTELPQAKLTFASFVNSRFKLRCQDRDIDEVLPLNMKNYTPCGGTPLVDCIMKTIALVEQQVNINPDVQPIVVIQTDGQENGSKHYTMEDLRKIVTQKRKEGWQFILIACKLDATALADEMGVDPGAALTYGKDKTIHAFEATSRLTTQSAKTKEEQVFQLEDRRKAR